RDTRLVDSAPGSLASPDTRSGRGLPAQSLALVPNVKLSHLGPVSALSVRRGFWLSGPTPRCNGFVPHGSKDCPRAPSALSRAPIRRGRCSTLVAPALRRRHSQSLFR